MPYFSEIKHFDLQVHTVISNKKLHYSQERGLQYMRKVATSESQAASHLVRLAQYNLGRAYFQGYGVPRSDSEAEKY